MHLNCVAFFRAATQCIHVWMNWNDMKTDCWSLFPEVYGKRNDLLTAPSNRASWSSALITSELHLGCFVRYCSITLWYSIVLEIINVISSSHWFAYTSVIQNISSMLTAGCILSACLSPFLGKFTWLFNEVQWQLHRILIWLPSKSLGESTGSKQMAEGIWWIIVCLRGQFVICIWFCATPSFS